MRLRVIFQPWKTEHWYAVEEWNTHVSNWVWVSSHNSEWESTRAAEARLKGPSLIKEYDSERPII